MKAEEYETKRSRKQEKRIASKAAKSDTNNAGPQLLENDEEIKETEKGVASQGLGKNRANQQTLL